MFHNKPTIAVRSALNKLEVLNSKKWSGYEFLEDVFPHILFKPVIKTSGGNISKNNEIEQQGFTRCF